VYQLGEFEMTNIIKNAIDELDKTKPYIVLILEPHGNICFDANLVFSKEDKATLIDSIAGLQSLIDKG
jgi:hypothetical protein